mmetsp:Transcript_33582/g.83897  ORF Transcript_33582/g.83897 Transcript_33582/m.83897 type:complete len:172 (+) Transcript_33582:3192-3707(+)
MPNVQADGNYPGIDTAFSDMCRCCHYEKYLINTDEPLDDAPNEFSLCSEVDRAIEFLLPIKVPLNGIVLQYSVAGLTLMRANVQNQSSFHFLEFLIRASVGLLGPCHTQFSHAREELPHPHNISSQACKFGPEFLISAQRFALSDLRSVDYFGIEIVLINYIDVIMGDMHD